jgi:hypothetical protein
MIEYQVKVYNNRTEWYLNGELHREDGPAIEFANGDKLWHLNGELHREDRPAVEFANGYKEWHLNGKFHREDGPAVESPSGYKAWYLNDQELTEEEFNIRTKSCVGKVIEIDGVQYKLVKA